MKVLVTGGAGFIASHVVDQLIDKGYDVVIVDNLSNGKKENLNTKAKFYREDITYFDGLKKIFEKEKPDIVCHHAAQIKVRESVKNPAFDAKINIIGSIGLLELSRIHKVKKFVYASSGGACYGNPVKLPCPESHPIAPVSPYGASKYAVENYLCCYNANYALDYTVLRYANVFGSRQDPYGEAGVIAIFIGKLLNNKVPEIFGDGEQTRDYVYVKDVARANLLAIEKKTKNKVFNIGTAKQVSVNELFAKIRSMINMKIDAKHVEAVPGEVRKIALDISLAKKDLGWSPEVSFEQGLKKTVEFVKGGGS